MTTDFKNQKVAVLGLGMEGECLVSWLSEQEAKVYLFDEKEEKDLTKSLKRVKSFIKKSTLGKGAFSNLSDFKIIFRSAGVYPYRDELQKARRRGAQILSETSLFFELCPSRIIGVTGTKGKGTTATLIYEMLKAHSKDVYLAGNIGEVRLPLLPKLKKDSWVVLELSSFQLIDLEQSPHVGVVLMTTSEHQNWHASPAEYIAAKANLLKFQGRGDWPIINADYPNSQKIGGQGKGQKYFFSRKQSVGGCYLKGGKIVFGKEGGALEEELMAIDQVRLRGAHNLENIMAASLAAKLLGISPKIIQEVVSNFKGLEHRLEEIGTFNGVVYYNDSFSTVPETAIAAIQSFREPIILIAGGSEKGSDFTQMGRVITNAPNLKAVILIGLIAERIGEAIEQAKGENRSAKREIQIIRGCQNMQEIVSAARKIAQAGDVVLLSPAAASFDMFANYKDRGEQFRAAVLTNDPRDR